MGESNIDGCFLCCLQNWGMEVNLAALLLAAFFALNALWLIHIDGCFLCCLQNWGMEVNLAALLLAAFFALNALSLVYMAIVALGMSLPADRRRAFWRWAVVPILGLLLLSQYSILLGLPPVDLSTGTEAWWRCWPKIHCLPVLWLPACHYSRSVLGMTCILMLASESAKSHLPG